MKNVAVVTGGGGSIGRETCRILARNGYSCVVADIIHDRALDTVATLENAHSHLAVPADVSTVRGVDRLISKTVEEFGRVDVLVNLAASNRDSFSQEDNLEQRWDKTIDNDLKSVYLLTERVVVEMQKGGGGAIVNVGSIAGGFLGSHSLPYSAAKAGICALTKSHARIYGFHNIRVNCIVPGIIDTRMVHDSVAQKTDDYFTIIKKHTPLMRWGRPEEIGEAIFFVASPKCAFMTGCVMIIDGGATLTLGPRLDEQVPFKWEKFTPDLSQGD